MKKITLIFLNLIIMIIGIFFTIKLHPGDKIAWIAAIMIFFYGLRLIIDLIKR